MDYSLFDEAARDHEEEAYQRRIAFVRTAVTHDVFPFLALANTEEEYKHRKALIYDRIAAIANAHESSLDETEAVADRLFGLFMEARKRGHQIEASLQAEAGLACKNCDHNAASTDHSEGLPCTTCGCTNFAPQTRTASVETEARRVTADEGEGGDPFQ